MAFTEISLGLKIALIAHLFSQSDVLGVTPCHDVDRVDWCRLSRSFFSPPSLLTRIATNRASCYRKHVSFCCVSPYRSPDSSLHSSSLFWDLLCRVTGSPSKIAFCFCSTWLCIWFFCAALLGISGTIVSIDDL